MNKYTLSYRFLNGNVHGCVFAKNRPVGLYISTRLDNRQDGPLGGGGLQGRYCADEIVKSKPESLQ